MSSGGLLFLLCALVFLSLLGSAFAHIAQERRARHALKVKQLTHSATQLSEAAFAIEPWCTLRVIPAELTGMAVRAWRNVVSEDPQSPHAATELSTIETLAQELSNGKAAQSGPMKLSTTQEITKVQKCLRNALAIFARLRENGGLSDVAFNAYTTELKWLILKAEVDSLLHQGNLAQERNDKVRFLGFYQRALTTLKKSSLPDPRKNEYIKVISDRLADRDISGAAATAN